MAAIHHPPPSSHPVVDGERCLPRLRRHHRCVGARIGPVVLLTKTTVLLRYAGQIQSPTTISQPNLAAAVVAVVDLPPPPPSPILPTTSTLLLGALLVLPYLQQSYVIVILLYFPCSAAPPVLITRWRRANASRPTAPLPLFMPPPLVAPLLFSGAVVSCPPQLVVVSPLVVPPPPICLRHSLSSRRLFRSWRRDSAGGTCQL